jgi:hypothetical protein
LEKYIEDRRKLGKIAVPAYPEASSGGKTGVVAVSYWKIRPESGFLRTI